MKYFYTMGGNSEGVGNVTPSAEFNFYVDPEAAHVVLQQLEDLGPPVKSTIVPLELCLTNYYSWVIVY